MPNVAAKKIQPVYCKIVTLHDFVCDIKKLSYVRHTQRNLEEIISLKVYNCVVSICKIFKAKIEHDT